MTCLVCLVEEKSAQIMLDIILPKMLPKETTHKVIPFEGKQDLEKHIEGKLKGWNKPNSVFLIMRDQDTGNCKIIKQNLLTKIVNSGKQATAVVRIACHELESFYLGDLQAVATGLKQSGLEKLQNKQKFRNPDSLSNAKQELEKITKDYYQPTSGSRAISPHLVLDKSNKSVSFNALLDGIKQLIEIR